MVVEAEGYRAAPSGLQEGATADGARPIMIVRNGRFITDDEGLSVPDVSRAGHPAILSENTPGLSCSALKATARLTGPMNI